MPEGPPPNKSNLASINETAVPMKKLDYDTLDALGPLPNFGLKADRTDGSYVSDGQSVLSTDDGLAPSLFGGRSPPGSAAGDERALRPLLKASPPTPVGETIGRYRIRIWRASKRQPLGINFVVSGTSISIGNDLEHLGLRAGDFMVNVNGRKAMYVDECRRMLNEALYVDMVLQHRELELQEEIVAPEAASCSWNLLSLFGKSPAPPRALVEEDDDPARFAPGMCPGSQRANPVNSPNAQPLRVLLSTSRPSTIPEGSECDREKDAGVEYELTLQRVSLRQRFGLNFSFLPRESTDDLQKPQRIFINEEAYQMGVKQGDLVLAVNGVPYERPGECQRILERSMAVTMRLKRLNDKNGNAQISLPPDVENMDEEVQEVLLPNSQVCGNNNLLCA